jgi:hypothetical protein
LKIFLNPIGVFLFRTFRIGVVEAQDERPAGLARDQVVDSPWATGRNG